MSAPAFCRHGRLSDGCEDCAVLSALERGVALPTPVPVLVPVVPEVADRDTDVELSEGRSVFVAAGDPFPLELVAGTRHPRRPEPADAAAAVAAAHGVEDETAGRHRDAAVE